MTGKITLIPGDGIGPEIVSAAVCVLKKVEEQFGHSFSYTKVLAGGCAIDETGEPLPAETVRICKESDGILMGAVGGPKWEGLPGHMRPEKALLGIRKKLGLYANIRPAKLFPSLASSSPLRPDLVEQGLDFIVVRELTGGIYYGERGRRESNGIPQAFDTKQYGMDEIERIGTVAFNLAMKRRKKLVSVDKANVLETSRLWREGMHRLSKEYPEVEYSDMLVDNAAMQLVRFPSQFDVMVTSNLFGDILSDEASVLTGSIGLLPSASLGNSHIGLYEPIHGSAPDLAGTGKANPIGTILSAAMLLRHSFSLIKEAACIEVAVENTLNSGVRTADIAGEGKNRVSTQEMTEQIVKHMGTL